MWVTVALMANHELIRLKRFVSQFPPNCAISFYFYLYLMFYAYIQRFDVMFLEKTFYRALALSTKVTFLF